MPNLQINILQFWLILLATTLMLTVVPTANATGESCGAFSPCASSNDFCSGTIRGTCERRAGSTESCSGLRQGTCLSGLVCDFFGGECRAIPGNTGELCSGALPCGPGKFCPSATGSRCQTSSSAGGSCNLLISASCQSGLVCDVNSTCRHDPPILGEPCGVGVSCANGATCSALVGGTCELPAAAGEACNLLISESCQTGLVCDATSICRHDPPILGEPCGAGVGCDAGATCSALVGGTCQLPGAAGDSCNLAFNETCEIDLVCDAGVSECRHPTPELGEPCGTGVNCAADLTCSAVAFGRCEEAADVGESCLPVVGGTTSTGLCKSDLVCDAGFAECRNDPPVRGQPCGIGVSCSDDSVCSADVRGRCGDRGLAGDSCSGILQGSCSDGLVCDGGSRVCQHSPAIVGENCGPLVACAEGLVCPTTSFTCQVARTAGEGCSIANPCGDGLSCEVCTTDGCTSPLQCFPNANSGLFTERQCRGLFSDGLQQTATDLGGTVIYVGGSGSSAGISTSLEAGVAYSPDGRYGCLFTTCTGAESNLSTEAFTQVGVYTSFDDVAGESTAFVQSAGVGVASFSTSQVFQRLSADPFDIGRFIGSENSLSLGISAVPISAGAYSCDTLLDEIVDTPSCGNGTVDMNEGCDDGNTSNDDGCSASCTVEASCGNGRPDEGETCDDGNTTNGDGCSSTCMVEPACGNNQLDAGELCDDGNLSNGDGCSSTCEIEPGCGNLIIEAGETCDDGNTADGDGCSSQCAIEPGCGNGLTEPGESCDDGNLLEGDGCSSICTIEPFCGDGAIDAGEQCDDGNRIDGDGCSASCEIEMTELPGDIDGNGVVDRNDARQISSMRNRPAADCPACDIDGDGRITVGDARKMVLLCTLPRCATPR